MTEVDHMAAGRACLDCGGSPTRDYEYGCEHRFLAPRKTKLLIRVESITHRILRGFEPVGDRLVERHMRVRGHGVAVHAPTRDAAVALWHRRVREVGEALVAFFEGVHRLPTSAERAASLGPAGAAVGALTSTLPAAVDRVTRDWPMVRWSCSGGDFEVNRYLPIGMLVECIEREAVEWEAGADRALSTLGHFVTRGIHVAAVVEPQREVSDRWELAVSDGESTIRASGCDAVAAVLNLEARLDSTARPPASEAPDWWAANPDDGEGVSTLRLRLKGEWLRAQTPAALVDRYAAALAFARAHDVGFRWRGPEGGEDTVQMKPGICAWTVVVDGVTAAAPTLLEAIEMLRGSTCFKDPACVGVAAFQRAPHDTASVLCDDCVTVWKGTSCGPSTPPMIQMLPPQSTLTPSEAEALHQRIERHNDAIAARAILPRNVIIAGIAGPDTHGQPVGYMEPPDPDAPTEATLPRACYGLTTPAACEECGAEATLLLTSPGSSRVLCEACAGDEGPGGDDA